MQMSDMQRLRFFVDGLVYARRPRATVRGKHASMHMGADHRLDETRVIDRAEAALRAQGFGLIVGPLWLDLTIWVKRPKTRRPKRPIREVEWCARRPDLDNVAKIIMDGMTKANVWPDDTHVACLTVDRKWIPFDEQGHDLMREGVEVSLAALGVQP